MIKRVVGLCFVSLALTACSKSPVAQAPDAGPDNALTRYAENLHRDEQRAQEVTNKANRAIAQEEKMAKQAAHESADSQ